MGSSGRYVRIVVRDSESGIHTATATKSFEPFFTTKEQGKGTGLGLATVFGIVRQSGGDVLVRSVLGEGHHLHSTRIVGYRASCLGRSIRIR